MIFIEIAIQNKMKLNMAPCSDVYKEEKMVSCLASSLQNIFRAFFWNQTWIPFTVRTRVCIYVQNYKKLISLYSSEQRARTMEFLLEPCCDCFSIRIEG